jgi:serine/threonine-protein kinase
MAKIHLARLSGPEGFEKKVVIKRAHRDIGDPAIAERMFVEEAKIAARIDHDGVAQVLDLGRDADGRLFIAMEHVDGPDLAHLTAAAERRALRLPIAFSLHVAAEVLDALAFVHDLLDDEGRPLGVVHRDATPSNVIISHHGKVKLCDFGVAHYLGKSQTTLAGQLKGKPAYMPPEQLNGQDLDRRSDLYTVGVWLWECLAQERLFAGRDPVALLLEVFEGRRRPPSSRMSDVPPSLDASVLKALAQRRDDRFADARAFRDELRRIMHNEHLTMNREDVARVVSAILGRSPPPAEITGRHKTPAERAHRFLVTDEEAPTPIASFEPPMTPHAAASEASIWLRSGSREEKVLVAWDAAFDALQEAASEEARVEVSADRVRWMRLEEFATLVGLDLVSESASGPSNLTVVGSSTERSVLATFSVLQRDRASGVFVAVHGSLWYEIHLADGRPVHVSTNVARAQKPALYAEAGIIEAKDIVPLFRTALRERRPLESLIADARGRRLDATALWSNRLIELLRWADVDYTFSVGRAPKMGSPPIARSIFSGLARAIDRGFSEKELADRLSHRTWSPLSCSWRFGEGIAEMELSPEDRTIAERLRVGAPIGEWLEARAADAKRILVLAYLLLESDLLLEDPS